MKRDRYAPSRDSFGNVDVDVLGPAAPAAGTVASCSGGIGRPGVEK